MIANADIVITIDQRGVAKLVKHRYDSTEAFDVEVKLTRREPVVNRYVSKPEDTLNLASDEEIEDVFAKRAAIAPSEIVKMLRDAAAAGGAPVKITGTKVTGDRYYDRLVLPKNVTYDQKYLSAEDPSAPGGRRTFRIDLIERVEAA